MSCEQKMIDQAAAARLRKAREKKATESVFMFRLRAISAMCFLGVATVMAASAVITLVDGGSWPGSYWVGMALVALTTLLIHCVTQWWRFRIKRRACDEFVRGINALYA
jgi:formate/nitrite transporter FocA (FNT family)